MCGLAGEYNPNGVKADEKIMTAMTDAMRHRGPHGSGIWMEDRLRCLLGHRRLPIIDLSEAAAQPISNEQGNVHLVYNGAIYNHVEIRQELISLGVGGWKTSHSDTEVLLKAYETWGLDCLSRFYGMFAFAVYDARNPERPTLHLVRDRIGIKPLYLARKGNSWVFGSEIKALLKHPLISPEMEPTALCHYLTFVVTPAPTTLFKDIFKIPAGHLVTIDHQGVASTRQYWDCRPTKNEVYKESDLSFEEAVAEFTRLMKLSIQRRMVADVPFGVLLSGGVDSSLNVALMSEIMNRPVTTFSIGYSDAEDLNEFTYASRVAELYKTDHHTTMINSQMAQDFLPLMVRLQDEPIADNVCIPLYFLAELVKKQGTTVVQVGEGADESFLGYWWCQHYLQKYENVWKKGPGEASSLIKRFLRWSGLRPGIQLEDQDILQRRKKGKELFWGGSVSWWNAQRALLTPSCEPFKSRIDCPVENLMPASHAGLDSAAVVSHYLGALTGNVIEPEVLAKIVYMEFKLRMPEHLLMRVDKMTMAHSIEARVPFLDHDIVDFARKLPPSYKIRDGIGKAVVKKAAEPYLPHDLIYRKKQGFGAPVDRWMKTESFAKRVRNLINRSALFRDGYMDKNYFSSIFERSITHNDVSSLHIFTVLNVMLWHEHWIVGNEDCF